MARKKILESSRRVAAVFLARAPLKRVDQRARLGQSQWSIVMWWLPRLSFALPEGVFMTMRLFACCIFAVLRTSQEQLGSTSTASLCAFFKACVAPALQSIHARSVLRLHSHRGLNSQTSFENGCIILYTSLNPKTQSPTLPQGYW